MKHPNLIEWEKKLKKLFDEIDDYLEDKYGGSYPLHPAREERGRTSNREQDGLFNVGTSYTPGFGSELGKGYIVDVDMATLSNVPDDVIKKVEADVISEVERKLPEYFPGHDLQVKRDGKLIKIYGDLSLGEV